jgi:hypothetical protein
MTDVQQVKDDLRFVREAIDRRSPMGRENVLAYFYWAFYVLVGYFLLDINPKWAGFFFLGGAVFGFGLMGFISRRLRKRGGEINHAQGRRSGLHWGGGIVGGWIAVNLLAVVIPALRGPAGGQVMVVLFGMVYFLWGVHVDKSFLVLGPIMMICAILIGFVPHYPWTLLGAVIAFGLVIAGIRAEQSIRRETSGDPQITGETR